MSVQGDLLAPEEEAYGPELDGGPHREPRTPWGTVHPSPLDGLVHQLTAAAVDRGTRVVSVKCGATLPKYRSHERLAGASGFASKVTCPACFTPCTRPGCPCHHEGATP